jgi:uncharacterized membrane protein YdjX (TVP38/TMEM64 family)
VKKKNKFIDKLPLFVSITIILMLVCSYFLMPGVKEWVDEAYSVLTSDDEVRINTYVKQYGLGGPVAIIIGMTLQMFLFFIPNILLMMIAIISYVPFWGSLISLIGVFVSYSLGYHI